MLASIIRSGREIETHILSGGMTLQRSKRPIPRTCLTAPTMSRKCRAGMVIRVIPDMAVGCPDNTTRRGLACLHLGEPSCRWFNRFLDRSALFGDHGFLVGAR
jgi:hypothetical protein